MSDVRPREGGPYSLYCYDCKRWIPNTANYETRKEGGFSHRHICVENNGKRIIIFEPGIEDKIAINKFTKR